MPERTTYRVNGDKLIQLMAKKRIFNEDLAKSLKIPTDNITRYRNYGGISSRRAINLCIFLDVPFKDIVMTKEEAIKAREPQRSPITKRIESILNERGKSIYSLVDEGVARMATIDDWMITCYEPALDSVRTVAKFLSVSAEYLLTGKKNPDSPISRSEGQVDQENEGKVTGQYVLINLASLKEDIQRGMEEKLQDKYLDQSRLSIRIELRNRGKAYLESLSKKIEELTNREVIARQNGSKDKLNTIQEEKRRVSQNIRCIKDFLVYLGLFYETEDVHEDKGLEASK